jgi:hypothetical protein
VVGEKPSLLSFGIVAATVSVPAIGIWSRFEPLRLLDRIWPCAGAGTFLRYFEGDKLLSFS